MVRFASKTSRILAIFAIVGLVAVIALVSALWLERGTELALPTPSGPFPVGRGLFDDQIGKELLIWIWYPAAAPGSPDDYMPPWMRAPREHALGPVLRLLTRDYAKGART